MKSKLPISIYVVICHVCVLIVSACKVKRPDSVISESEMENLLYDYHIAKVDGREHARW